MKHILPLFLLVGAGAIASELDLTELDLGYPSFQGSDLVVGGQPSKADFKKLAAAGFTRVINLRPPGEFSRFDEEAVVRAYGMDYINIPVYDMEDFTAEKAKLLHEALESNDGPVLLHCTIGARVGALLGVEKYLFHDYSREEAKDLASEVHMHHLEGNVERALDRIGKIR